MTWINSLLQKIPNGFTQAVESNDQRQARQAFGALSNLADTAGIVTSAISGIFTIMAASRGGFLGTALTIPLALISGISYDIHKAGQEGAVVAQEESQFAFVATDDDKTRRDGVLNLAKRVVKNTIVLKPVLEFFGSMNSHRS